MQDNQELIEKVKKETCIFELADQFGARPSSNGSCKHNPLRSERTCSLKLYRATNTYSDFGDEAGDVISFYMKATGCDFKKAIEDLSGENLEKPKKLEPIKNNNTYMLPEAIERAFNSIFHKNVNFKNEQQLEKLKTIAPLWVYSEADKIDLTFFKSITKWVQNLTTTIHKMPDRNDISHTMKYRYYFDEEKNKMIKWRTVTSTKSSYLYCRLTNRDTILIVEGARDFLTASLLGFDVVSLYSKNYKFTEDDYKLLPLEEVEAHIVKNGHLPNVPSAEEVAKEGIDLAKMDAKLLEKIEELTLYVIEQQKQIKKLQEQLKTK